MPDDEMLDPEKMQSIVDRLKAEGRMPTPEILDQAMAETRARYQRQVGKVRREDQFQAAKRRRQASKDPSQKTS